MNPILADTNIIDIEDHIMAMEFFSALSKTNKAIIGLWLNGYKTGEISRLVGLSRTGIQWRIDNVRNVLAKHYIEAKRPLRIFQEMDFRAEEKEKCNEET